MNIKFAHLTDIHLPIREKPRFIALANKRVLGYLSWSRRRIDLHKQEACDALAADMAAQGCDAAVISGDLVNIALPAEFEDARRWLDDRFEGVPTVFAPGNHDTYVRADWARTLGLLSPYMLGDHIGQDDAREASGFDDFPFLRHFAGAEDAAFIVANSAPSTAPGLASGRLGDEQIARIKQMLIDTRRQFQVLVLHHPVNDGVEPARKALSDREKLRKMIAETGVDLVLHGHTHAPVFGAVETPSGLAPVIGGGSASHPYGRGKYRPARYNLFSLSKLQGGRWRLELAIRELDPDKNTVATIESRRYERYATE
ncbi:putative phosphohydrolases, Icc family [hydrothermal vent metagenome]|uniref:Putative phosphohydrolases, Icc family n=1 Tax=hydrothermal vent metagenome TaxID=652676 RepID=A0A3B0RYJ0_9ZZZZ